MLDDPSDFHALKRKKEEDQARSLALLNSITPEQWAAADEALKIHRDKHAGQPWTRRKYAGKGPDFDA